jgi:undecaprenyl diphosphate synthase
MSIFGKKKKTELPVNLPQHIGIIMDGNGRWAKKRMLPRSAGHAAGSENFKTIARYCNKIGIKYLTVYAFSTENWKRPKSEVDAIMDLLRKYLKDSTNFKEENIRLLFIGELSALPEDIRELIKQAEYDSKDATGLTVNMAVNYGGRDEIVHAVKDIYSEIEKGNIKKEDITEQMISDRLYTSGQSEPDFIIRPSGEYRLSNFLVWQSAYAEFWYSDVLWPDFTTKDLDRAIADFNKRNRRFGGVEAEDK